MVWERWVRVVWGFFIFTFIPLIVRSSESSNKLPNFLIIIGDDATYSDLPLYGGKNIETPNIENLAEQGITFNHAYLSMAMCSPCRAELYTGLYPMSSGVCWNHSNAKPGTKTIVHHFNDIDYRVGIAGKTDVRPEENFPFKMVPGFERNCVSETAKHDTKGIKRFMSRNKDQPFCLIVGLVVPHVPWTVGNPQHFNPKEIKLPPYLADTKETRKNFAQYLAEIEVMDQQVGDILKTLEETGQSDNTLVIFTSEQGAQWPGCKWTNWDQGVHTGFVVRWSVKIKPGIRTDAMIQYEDVLPTLLEAAHVDPASKNLDGSSFLSVLRGEDNEHRKFVYFMHNNVPEGPPYPIRSVRTKKYHYIRNLTPNAIYIEKHMMSMFGDPVHSPYWITWMYAAAEDTHAYQMVKRYMHRPAEQLYDTENDPNEFNNLAEDSNYWEVKKRLSEELEQWMKKEKDPGATLDKWSEFQNAYF